MNVGRSCFAKKTTGIIHRIFVVSCVVYYANRTMDEIK